jgi:hypothetical protein
VRFGEGQQLAKHILVVLPIPDLAQLAGRVVQLRQLGVDIRVAAGLRTTIPTAPEFP